MQLFYRFVSSSMVYFGIALVALSIALTPAVVFAQTTGGCPGNATCDTGCTKRQVGKCPSTQQVCGQANNACDQCYCTTNGAGTACTCD